MQAATLLKYDISHWFPRDAGGRKYGLVITELYNKLILSIVLRYHNSNNGNRHKTE